jgi:hypothetical protein
MSDRFELSRVLTKSSFTYPLSLKVRRCTISSVTATGKVGNRPAIRIASPRPHLRLTLKRTPLGLAGGITRCVERVSASIMSIESQLICLKFKNELRARASPSSVRAR